MIYHHGRGSTATERRRSDISNRRPDSSAWKILPFEHRLFIYDLYTVYVKRLSVVQNIQLRMTQSLLNNELGRTWKEVFVTV
jgi:hypothetical protein